MRKILMGSLAACVAILVSASVADARENWLGTWKLNVAKSKYSPGPGPKSLTLKFETTPEGVKLTSEGVSAEGKATKASYQSKYDGTTVAFEGNPDAETAAPKKIDDNTYENAWTKGGKVTIATKGVVSADGKTLTVTMTGTNAKGQAVSNTAVYDKQ
jgi:hypothetical protein